MLEPGIKELSVKRLRLMQLSAIIIGYLDQRFLKKREEKNGS